MILINVLESEVNEVNKLWLKMGARLTKSMFRTQKVFCSNEGAI